MSRAVVAGIGNRIMADDAIGLRTVEAIQDDLADHHILSLIGETNFMYCLDNIPPDSFLIVVDAVRLGLEPGSIISIPLNDISYESGFIHTQHDQRLIDSIAMVYPEISGYLIGIEACDIAFGLSLSDTLAERFNRICADVTKEILILCSQHL